MTQLTAQVNRRSVIKGMSLFAAGAGLAPLLAACGGGGSSGGADTAAAEGSGSGAATDRIAFADIGPIRDLNPDGTQLAYWPNVQVWQAVYDNLTRFAIPADLEAAKAQGAGEGFVPQPALAASWDISNDGRTYRFTLQEGAVSEHGNTLTADDVVWSVRKTIESRTIGSSLYSRGGVTSPDLVRAVDDLTVEFSLEEPSPILLQVLTMPWLTVYDSQAIQRNSASADPLGAEWLAKNTAGFGPYAYRAENPSTTALTRRDDYWGDAPAIASISVRAIDNATSRLQLLSRGEVAAANLLSPLQLDTVARTKGADVKHFTSAVGSFLVMNLNQPPFDDVEVRRAIARAIPYEDIIATVYRGRGEHWRSFLPPWFFAATIDDWPYDTDPEAARAVLSKLGGKPVTLSVREGGGGDAQTGTLLQTALTQAGMNVQLKPIPSTVFDERKFTGRLGLFISEDIPAIPNSFYSLQSYFSEAGGLNIGRYRNPELESLVLELRRTSLDPDDVEGQRALVEQIQKLVADDLPWIPMVFAGSSLALEDGVDFDTVQTTGGYAFYRYLRTAS